MKKDPLEEKKEFDILSKENLEEGLRTGNLKGFTEHHVKSEWKLFRIFTAVRVGIPILIALGGFIFLLLILLFSYIVLT